MIVYLDSSYVTSRYLPDELDHREVQAVMDNPDVVRITGRLTRLEVSGALVRAESANRIRSAQRALSRLDADLGDDGVIAVLDEDQSRVDELALQLVRSSGMHGLDALHLATAALLLPNVAEPGEGQAFATRDREQGEVAAGMGLEVL